MTGEGLLTGPSPPPPTPYAPSPVDRAGLGSRYPATGCIVGKQATAEELADIELLGRGYGLHWEQLDVDYTVPGLVNGVFGTARWMAARAGRATSPAKAEAARANGAKGGRPRKAG